MIYQDPFDPEDTIRAINQSLKERYNYPLPTGNSKQALAARMRDQRLKDSRFQRQRVTSWEFSPTGIGPDSLSAAENNTVSLYNRVMGMPDEMVSKFERIIQAYPNQSPGFYTALIESPEFDITHPEFENVAAVDLEESAATQVQNLPSRSGTSPFRFPIGDDAYTPFDPAEWLASARPALPSGSAVGDDIYSIPQGYGDTYGGTPQAPPGTPGIAQWAAARGEEANRAGSGVGWLDPARWLVRNTFGALASGQQALLGGMRSEAGVLADESVPTWQRFMGSLSGVTGSATSAATGAAVRGEPAQAPGLLLSGLKDITDQTFLGQMVKGNDTGEGWFPAGEAAEKQASAVWEAHNIDGQVWSLGVQASHALGMDPESSAYHWLSGTIDLAATIGLDPTVIGSKYALPSKLLAATGRAAAGESFFDAAGGVARVSSGTASKVESATLRGGTRKSAREAEAFRLKNMTTQINQAKEDLRQRGYTPEQTAQIENHFDQLLDAMAGKYTPENAALMGEASRMGMVQAAKDYVARVDQEIAEGADPVKKLGAYTPAINREMQQLEDQIVVPENLTGEAAESYRAWTALLRNQGLYWMHEARAQDWTNTAGGLRRPRYEEEYVAGHLADLGEQGDLAVRPKALEPELMADPYGGDTIIQGMGDEMVSTYGFDPPTAVGLLNSTLTDSPYGPLPNSFYTLDEGGQNGYALGNVNGELALVRPTTPKREVVSDPLTEDVQRVLTGEHQPTGPELTGLINQELIRNNINPDELIQGRLAPSNPAADFDLNNAASYLFDENGAPHQGMDLLSALNRMGGTEARYSRNIPDAGTLVPAPLVDEAMKVIRAQAVKAQRTLKARITRAVKGIHKSVPGDDPVIAAFVDQMNGLTNLIDQVDAAVKVALGPDGPGLKFGELLALAGRFGAHGQLAELLRKNGVEGIRNLSGDGTVIWWSERKGLTVGTIDEKGALAPLKHDDPGYFLVSREGMQYTAKTINEARRTARAEGARQFDAYAKNLTTGAKMAADARKATLQRATAQRDLQYHTAKRIVATEAQDIAQYGLVDELTDFMRGNLGHDAYQGMLDHLAESAGEIAQILKPLHDSMRAEGGKYTDLLSGDTPLLNPRVTMAKSKFILNSDSRLRPFYSAAFSKLSKTTNQVALRQLTKNRWDTDAYNQVLQNARRFEESQKGDGAYTEEMLLNDFTAVAATQMGMDLRTSVYSVRTALGSTDGPKMGREKRFTPSNIFDRAVAYNPNVREIDLSNINEVARRVIDYGRYHFVKEEDLNEILDKLTFGVGAVTQRSRIALEETLNKVNDKVLEGVEWGPGNANRIDEFKAYVKEKTRHSFQAGDEEARTYVEDFANGGPTYVMLYNRDGERVPVEAPSHLYENEQVGNFLTLPSTTDLRGMQRELNVWNKMRANTRAAGDENWRSTADNVLGTLDHAYTNLYRGLLLVRPAYIVRNFGEANVRSFLTNSPTAWISHPVIAFETAVGLTSESPLQRTWVARKAHPSMVKLKNMIGMYDQTIMGRGTTDFGKETVQVAGNNMYAISRGRRLIGDERTIDRGIQRNYKRVGVTDPKWVSGFAGELTSARYSMVHRFVAQGGLTTKQLKVLNEHLVNRGEQPMVVPEGGLVEDAMQPVAMLMYEALHRPENLKEVLRKHANDLDPEGEGHTIQNLSEWAIDQLHLYMDEIRATEGSKPRAGYLTDSPQNIHQGMLMSPYGYVARTNELTLGGDPALLGYLAHGGFREGENPWTQISTYSDGPKEINAVRNLVNSRFSADIKEAREIAERQREAIPTEGAQRVSDMMVRHQVWLEPNRKNLIPVLDTMLDKFFAMSNRVERLGSLGPEYASYYWRVLGDNAQTLSTAALADSEEAALRTLSPLRRLSKTGAPEATGLKAAALKVGEKVGTVIGKDHNFFREIERRRHEIDEYRAALADPDNPANKAAIEHYRNNGIAKETADKVADAEAYQWVKDLFYDAQERRAIFHQLRYASMFLNASMNTLSVWSREALRNPIQLYKGERFLYAAQQPGTGDVLFGPPGGMSEQERELYENNPNRAFIFKDDIGWKVNVPLIGTMMAAIPGGVTPSMVSASPVNYRLENLNLAMSGGSILPGISPIVTIPYAKFRGDVDNSMEKFLDGWFLPYGQRSLLETFAPSWLMRGATGFSNSFLGSDFGLNDDAILNNIRPAMAILYASGNYQNAFSDKNVNKSLLDDAEDLAAHMTFWQGIGQATNASAPQIDWAAEDKSGNTVGISALSSLFYDKYLIEYKGDYERAMAEFYDDYGMTGIFATTGARENLNKIPTSAGWDFLVANYDVAKGYGDYLYYFFPGDEPDMRARQWMEEQGLREVLTPEEQINQVAQNLKVMRKAVVNSKYANGLITEEENTFEKKQIDREFGDIADYTAKETANAQQLPNILNQMLGHQEFRETEVGHWATLALQWRSYYMDQADGSLGAKKNEQFKDAYIAKLDGILAASGGEGSSKAKPLLDKMKREF